MCTKIKYFTQFEADKAIKSLEFKTCSKYRTYFCTQCSALHIAHKLAKAVRDNMITKFNLQKVIEK